MTHEEVLEATIYLLVGTPAILVSNQTELRGYSDNGHDCSVLCSSLLMYNLTTQTVNRSSCFFIISGAIFDVGMEQKNDGGARSD